MDKMYERNEEYMKELTMYIIAGKLRIEEREILSPHQILMMDWLVENIDGEIPTIEQLTPTAQELVKIQGVLKPDNE